MRALVRHLAAGASASPALIETSRTAVTDSAGQYLVELLRPGVYAVTSTLTGFSSVRREGIDRVDVMADFHDVFNASSVLSFVTTYGPAWLAPATILQSGFLKLGGRFTF
jgi:hypothetical protein